ncbi:MAG: iron chelate uptake ABC transporter family permease subunit [Terricaulis sp.]|nr:iron chelate uptake ABC transporter family permease subunit [Terricaulis sp.]
MRIAPGKTTGRHSDEVCSDNAQALARTYACACAANSVGAWRMEQAEVSAPNAAAEIGAQYRAVVARRAAIVAGLALVSVIALLFDVITGPSSLSAGTVLQGLIQPDALSASQAAIVWQVRLPYALMAVLVGAALSLAGAEMQTILNNALASPFTLGVSSAASFGPPWRLFWVSVFRSLAAIGWCR